MWLSVTITKTAQFLIWNSFNHNQSSFRADYRESPCVIASDRNLQHNSDESIGRKRCSIQQSRPWECGVISRKDVESRALESPSAAIGPGIVISDYDVKEERETFTSVIIIKTMKNGPVTSSRSAVEKWARLTRCTQYFCVMTIFLTVVKCLNSVICKHHR